MKTITLHNIWNDNFIFSLIPEFLKKDFEYHLKILKKWRIFSHIERRWDTLNFSIILYLISQSFQSPERWVYQWQNETKKWLIAVRISIYTSITHMVTHRLHQKSSLKWAKVVFLFTEKKSWFHFSSYNCGGHVLKLSRDKLKVILCSSSAIADGWAMGGRRKIAWASGAGKHPYLVLRKGMMTLHAVLMMTMTKPSNCNTTFISLGRDERDVASRPSSVSIWASWACFSIRCTLCFIRHQVLNTRVTF